MKLLGFLLLFLNFGSVLMCQSTTVVANLEEEDDDVLIDVEAEEFYKQSLSEVRKMVQYDLS